MTSIRDLLLGPVAVGSALALGLLATAARAEGRFSLDKEIQEVRGWTIAANKARNACFAFAAYRSKTVIEVGFDDRRDSAFMLFANESWKSIEVGATYDIKLIFDGRKSWTGKAEGVRAGSLPGLALEGVKFAFVDDFAHYVSVEVQHNKRRLDGFDLTGTRAAVDAAIDCTRSVRSGDIAFAETTPPPKQEKAKEAKGGDEKRPEPEKPRPASLSTGTGFFVSDKGHVVTNAHVVEDCKSTSLKLPDGRTLPATILARSTQNDLAVLKADVAPAGVARLRAGPSIRLGESIVLFGYPLAGELTVTGNLSTGLVSAMAGPGEDVTRMQISAPVQSGNSGGAVVDQSGKVVGVVVSKANTRPRGDGGSVEVLQNVNFAIKSGVAAYFLDANQIPYVQEAPDGDKSTADVAALTKDFSALVICRGE